MSDITYAGVMPVLALRGLAVFPEQTVHFDVSRSKSALALEAAMKKDQILFLAPQRDALNDDPKLADLYQIGTVVKVKQLLNAPSENLRVLVTGLSRARIMEVTQSEPYMSAVVESVSCAEPADSARGHALRRRAADLYASYLELTDHPSQLIQLRIMASDKNGFVADCIAQNSGMEFEEKISLLLQLNPTRRLEQTIAALEREMEVLRIEAEIQDKTRAAMDQNQRDYYLREQMHVIREELGEEDDEAETDEYSRKIRALHLKEEYETKLLKEVQKLKKQPFGSAESAVLRGYLDTVLELPWNRTSKERIDVQAASKVLEHDHFGLEKVKQRILETMAVRQMSPQMPPQILCLVGPPGVGKTSISYSIARSLNRKMVRISLGGVHDEADIRGHRKTYVGAMPGRIMAAMVQAGTRNPVLLLDEIDKMGSDYRGDPSAALLEVLDAEQNHSYRDHYLEIPFDLSDVMFITTANTLDTVPRPLLDRMEIIELNSYTDEEKLMIAKNHLVPKQLKKHGLKKSQLRIPDATLRQMISCYTRESGVRTLERTIADLCRKADKRFVDEPETTKLTVSVSDLEPLLGPRKFVPEHIAESDLVGVVTGLAWTSVGGETLEVEVNVMDGSGKLELTGNLGTVMKESVQAAVSYIRANASALRIPVDFYKTKDIHVHFPEGAVPKDGPSAGVTICTALVSALTNTPVRRDVAMTGEITLRGRVLRIGGLKEKTMAALRHGVHTVIIPADNVSDLEEIDQTVRSKLTFVPASTADTVLATALVHAVPPSPTVLGSIPEDAARLTRVGISQ